MEFIPDLFPGRTQIRAGFLRLVPNDVKLLSFVARCAEYEFTVLYDCICRIEIVYCSVR